jgi:hypothetical protein
MSIRALTVLLFAGLAFPAIAAADGGEYDQKYKVAWSAIRSAQLKRRIEESLRALEVIAGRLENRGDSEKKLAASIRKVLKLADDLLLGSKLNDVIRTLNVKNADRNRKLLDHAWDEIQSASSDLKSLRTAAEKCRPVRIETPALYRELEAARAALDVDGGKIDKELRAHVARLPRNKRPTGDLREMMDQVLVGHRGEGKPARRGGGEGKAGQDAGASHKPGGRKAGQSKEAPEGYFQLEGEARYHAELAALIDGLGAYLQPLEKVAGGLKGKARATCEGLTKRLAALHLQTLHHQLEKLAFAESVLAEVRDLVKTVRDDLIRKEKERKK